MGVNVYYGLRNYPYPHPVFAENSNRNCRKKRTYDPVRRNEQFITD
jgi:hypothetical protein